jgi:hypothetical protein
MNCNASGAPSALLGLPEDVVNFGDVLQQPPSRLVGGRFSATWAVASSFSGFIEQFIQLRVLLEVSRLEVIDPARETLGPRWLGTSPG